MSGGLTINPGTGSQGAPMGMLSRSAPEFGTPEYGHTPRYRSIPDVGSLFGPAGPWRKAPDPPLAYPAWDIARVLEVGDTGTGLGLKPWMRNLFALAGGLATDATSTTVRELPATTRKLGTLDAASTSC